MKSPWCRAFPRSFSDFSTILTVPSFVESLFMKSVAFASLNWVSKQLWIISSFTSSETFLMMTARFGFSVERALLIFVESPRKLRFPLLKNFVCLLFWHKLKMNVSSGCVERMNQSFKWKMISKLFLDLYTVFEVESTWSCQNVFRIALRSYVFLWASL